MYTKKKKRNKQKQKIINKQKRVGRDPTEGVTYAD